MGSACRINRNAHHVYTVLLWNYGVCEDAITTQSFREARAIWNRWNVASKWGNRSVELKIDGAHISYTAACKLMYTINGQSRWAGIAYKEEVKEDGDVSGGHHTGDESGGDK